MKTRLTIATLLTSLAVASTAAADVDISATDLRDYAVPAGISLADATFDGAPDGSTLIWSTTGNDAAAACTVLVANAAGATRFDYRMNDEGTACVGVIGHPDGGFFVRGTLVMADPDVPAGFTALIDAAGNELWKIPDQALVDAQPKPNGTGEFLGNYLEPAPSMEYSEQFDKLIAFTSGELVLGSDRRPVTQAHVINVTSGRLMVSGQTFGLSAVGVVGGTATRFTDGYFLLYLFSSGSQGAFFYSYNGRETIGSFKPLDEDWDERFITRMLYENDLYLLWQPNDDEGAETRVTVVNDDGRERWIQTFDPAYTFADGTQIDLGKPATMWVGDGTTIVLHVVTDQGAVNFYLRVIDSNGTSLGVGDLNAATELQPLAIVNGEGRRLVMLAYDEDTMRIHELRLEFDDTEDFVPGSTSDAGDTGPDADSGPGVSPPPVDEGCCSTTRTPTQTGAVGLVLFLVGFLMRRRV